MAKLTDKEKLKVILYDEEWRQRFWSYVDKSGGEDACWIWTGKNKNTPKKRKTYGQFRVKKGDPVDTHLLSLTMKLGYLPIADTLHDEKKCKDNKYKCVNPNHLRDGSPKENRIDENIAGKTTRQKNKRKELFEEIMEESSITEKKYFYEVLQNELVTEN
jgi:hypothetical protein